MAGLVVFASACLKEPPAPADRPPVLPMERSWSAELGAALAAPPAYSPTAAFVPVRDGRLLAVDLANGAIRWTAKIATATSPATGDSLVFAATAEAIDALGEADGAEVWKLPLDSAVTGPLFWQNGWLFAPLKGGTLVAVRATDGRAIWRREFGADIQVPPATEGPHLFVSLSDGRVAALTIETGEPVWERKLPGAAGQPLALPDRVFVGSADNFLYALDRDDGDVDWRWRTGADVIGAPVVDEARVYFASLDNVLRALDRKNGIQRWRTGLPLRPFAGPLLVRDVLVVSGLAPTLHGFRSADGTDAGEYSADAEIVAPPHVVFDPSGSAGLLIVTGDGQLHRLGRGIDPPAEPLRRIPGRRLEREPPPELTDSGV